MNKLKCSTFLTLIAAFQLSDSLRISRDSDSQLNSTTLSTLKSESSQQLHESIKMVNEDHLNSKPVDKSTQNLTSSSQAETTSKLFEVLNTTLINVNSLILDAMRNASGQKNEEFQRLGGVVRNVQTLISDQGTDLSMDASHQLATSLKNIQAFFTENEKHLQEHLMIRNGNLSIRNANPSEIIQAPKLDTKTSQNMTDGSLQRSGHNGPLDKIQRISSQVGQGVTASVRQVEDKLTSSITQIQTQIQSQIQNFIQGINNFFTSAGNVFQLPNLANLSNLTLSAIS